MPTATNHWSKEPGRWEPGFSPEAYALVPTITTPRPSPDGRRIAYSRGFDGRLDLWLIDADGGWPLQLTDAARAHIRVKAALEAADGRGFPEWLEVDSKAGKGVFKAYPQRAELPATINESLVVELYSR